MSWQEVFLHIGNFLLLPAFVGAAVGTFARVFLFKHSTYTLLIVAGFIGSLAGLILGWMITGQDGHSLGYALLIIFCTLFIFLTGGIPKD